MDYQVNMKEILNKALSQEYHGDTLGFIRTEYLNNIEKSLFIPDLIKVLIWQRRAGKSFIIRQLIHFLLTEKKVPKQDILYLNMELWYLQTIQSTTELQTLVELFLQNNTEWKKYLFIDEVQEILGREKYLNWLRADPNCEIEIIISGSNSKLLSWELATYIAGRYITFHISPFSFEEYLWITLNKNNKASLIDYLNIGWIPELYQRNDEIFRQNFMESLKDAVILKDIGQRYKIKDLETFKKLFYFLMTNIWNLTSLNSLSKTLQTQWLHLSVATLSTYLSYLQDIFVFHWIQRYDIQWKKILQWEKKYYLNDLSFLNYSVSNFESYRWKKLENFVFTTLLQKGFHIYIWNVWNNEIDFIAEKQWNKLYIQVCYLLSDENVIQREYWNLRKIKDSFPKYVVSLDDMQLPPDDYWIKHVQARNLEKILQ